MTARDHRKRTRNFTAPYSRQKTDKRRDQRRGHGHLGHVPRGERVAPQAAGAEPGREHRPEAGGSQADRVPSRDGRGRGHRDRRDDRVVIPGGRGPDLPAVTLRELLVQQRVEQALPLLPEADAPGSRADRVDDDRLGRPSDPAAPLQQGEVQVAVLAPGRDVSLVEPADGFQDVAPDEAVGRDELGRFRGRRRRARNPSAAPAAGRRRGRRPPPYRPRRRRLPRPASAGRGCSRRR